MSADEQWELTGVPASNGIAIGPAFLFAEEDLTYARRSIDDLDGEWSRLEAALAAARDELAELQQQAAEKVGAAEAAIFEAHALFLDDPDLLETARNWLETLRMNIETAWMQASEEVAAQLDAMEDEYFRARAADVRDVARRVLRILLGRPSQEVKLHQPSIVVARDLTPADTVHLDKSLVLAFCTAAGGATSHTAILAKALGLPAVVGVGDKLLSLRSGTRMIIDGGSGKVILHPDGETERIYRARWERANQEAGLEKEAAWQPVVTRDGRQVEVVANIGSVEEAATALEFGAEGVGLLRTEFIYLSRDHAPDEEEQLAAYRAILAVMGSHPVVARTLDVGGDKELPYLDLGHEANPFLGVRAIRMCLERPDLFRTQLRALLRASPGHDLRIMFPMIATLEEVRQARAFLADVRAELEAEGKPVAEQCQVGIMVEIPSVAAMADHFARQVDFFSIGTNDLTQYTMAADRTNQKLAHLTDACHPAVLRQIRQVIDAGHAAGIWVGLCGELAGDPDAAPVLLGLGLDEFSMAPSSIPRAKRILRQWSQAAARQLAEQALALDSAEAVRQLVRAADPT